MSDVIEHRFVTCDRVRLHCALAGPVDGPLVVLLHGFPEAWFGWRGHIEALAARGFRVVAPDQRGYNDSDKPTTLVSYTISEPVADVEAIIRALGHQRAHVAGHDWGGAVAWWLAMTRPYRVDRLAILNMPHPQVLDETLRHSAEQRRKSTYAALFQIPWLPERVLGWRRGQRLAKMMKSTSKPRSFSEAKLAEYRTAWTKPEALRAMLDWYRASVRFRSMYPDDVRVKAPTLIMWGTQDAALSASMIDPSAVLCDDVEVVRIEDATHWVHHDASTQVTARLAAHFNRPRYAP